MGDYKGDEPKGVILYADTNEVIDACPNKNFHHVFTSVPDISETEYKNLRDYTEFFEKMVARCLEKCKDEGYVIFYQTDSKVNGYWLNKAFMIYDVARISEVKLIFHKIVLRKEVGKTDRSSPTYSHLLCFSRKSKHGSKKHTFPDVLPVSKSINRHSTPEVVCNSVMNFIEANQPDDIPKHKHIIFDPFCGEGAILCEAKKRGYSIFGMEIDKDKVEACEKKLG